jgi:tetratricopeptide (TPR) repeat protein
MGGLAPIAVTQVDMEPPISGVARISRISDHEVVSEMDLAGTISDVLAIGTHLPAGDVLALGKLRDPPFVGRGDERFELETMIEEVVGSRRPGVIVYVGEPGIGKSRLARWGLAHVERKGRMEGMAGGYDTSGVDTAGGLRHALRSLLGAPDENAWSWLAGEPGVDVPALVRYARADDTSETLSQERVVQLVHAVVRAVARTRPVYLWLDDLGWARDGAVALVERLLEVGDAPVLVVGTLETGAAQHAVTRGRLDRILAHPAARLREIGPLAVAERAALLDGLVPLAPGLASSLAERLDGSPLLLVQLVNEWIDDGWLVQTEDGWAPRKRASFERMLDARSLKSLVVNRLDVFLAGMGARADQAGEILVRAALLGMRFEHGALRAACASDRALGASVEDVIDRALLAGLLRSELGRVYAFEHGLVHEALAQRASRAALIDGANGLFSRYGKERADILAAVASLLRRAGDRDRAWECQTRAIERAAWASDQDSASNYLVTALSWADDEPERRASALYVEARVHYFLMRYETALDRLHDARHEAQQAGDAALAMRCDALEADVLFYLDRFADAEDKAKSCVEAVMIEDPDLAAAGAQACHRLGDLAVLRGALEESLDWRRKAIAYTEAGASQWRIRIARLNLAEHLQRMGRGDEARKICEEALAEAESTKDDDAVMATREVLARFDALDGREDVHEFLANRADHLEAAGDGWRLSAVAPFEALCARAEHLPAAAARALRALEAVPNDETLTPVAVDRLIARLERVGQSELAQRFGAWARAREAKYRAGFAR